MNNYKVIAIFSEFAQFRKVTHIILAKSPSEARKKLELLVSEIYPDVSAFFFESVKKINK
jgi:hypothetical protein